MSFAFRQKNGCQFPSQNSFYALPQKIKGTTAVYVTGHKKSPEIGAAFR
jgi:hypothetical protein